MRWPCRGAAPEPPSLRPSASTTPHSTALPRIPDNVKRQLKQIFLAALLAATGAASAATNPDPAIFLDDTGDAFAFPFDVAFAVEAIDGFDGRFGFYYPSEPFTLIEIFGFEDVGGGQFASLDFTTGTVFDIDATEIQASFTPQPASPLGFWYEAGRTVLYSDPGLNGGLDVVGFFPLVADPDVFAVIFDDPGSVGLFSVNLIDGMLPASAVPLPGTAFLLGIPLAFSLLRGRRREAIAS